MRVLVLVLLLLLPGHIHVLLYFLYRVLYYSTTCYNPATGCYMIIINYSNAQFSAIQCLFIFALNVHWSNLLVVVCFRN